MTKALATVFTELTPFFYAGFYGVFIRGFYERFLCGVLCWFLGFAVGCNGRLTGIAGLWALDFG